MLFKNFKNKIQPKHTHMFYFPYQSKSMSLIWQIMAHTWLRYGIVKTSCGIDMVPSFVKFQAMESILDWKPFKDRFEW